MGGGVRAALRGGGDNGHAAAARHRRAGRLADGDKELMEAFKEMGIKKMGHRQAIVNAVLGLLP